MVFKLNWQVDREADGSFVRRTVDGDAFHLSYIDINWIYDGDFPEDTIDVPTSHPPNIKYKRVPVGRRKIIKDQITVRSDVPDSTVAMMLDEKRQTLSKTLNLPV